MDKYTRKQINVKAQLHDKEFVTLEDVNALMITITKAAINAGADEDKLMEFFNEKD